jgi:hypothetical protein
MKIIEANEQHCAIIIRGDFALGCLNCDVPAASQPVDGGEPAVVDGDDDDGVESGLWDRSDVAVPLPLPLPLWLLLGRVRSNIWCGAVFL